MMIFEESTPIERGAILARHFMDGGTLTAKEAAAKTGVSVRQAQRDLNAISRTLHIVQDEDTWQWRLVQTGVREISPY